MAVLNGEAITEARQSRAMKSISTGDRIHANVNNVGNPGLRKAVQEPIYALSFVSGSVNGKGRHATLRKSLHLAVDSERGKLVVHVMKKAVHACIVKP